ncbi:hypothetical protein KVG29_10020 [Caldicoprobacter algeriensis]|nr:hypothetical protein [Caldicoprobacter algeriensis]
MNFYVDKAILEETKRIFEEVIEIKKQHFDTLEKEYDKLGSTEAPIDILCVVDDN